MRSRHLLLVPLALAGFLPTIVGCSSGGSAATSSVIPPAPKADVHSVDWRDASYSVACPGLGGPSDQQVPVTLANGSGTTAAVTWFGKPVRLDVHLRSVAYGDLTGEGHDEAVVHLTCTPQLSNGVADEVQVFGPGSVLLGTPVLHNRFASDFAPSIKTLSVAGGHITGSAFYWGPNDPHCCPSQSLPFTLTWDAGRSAFDQS
jgi:hypothetical protein